MFPHRRPPLEGRAAAKSSGWHGGSRSDRKIGPSGEGGGAYSYTHERETSGGEGGGGGAENGKLAEKAAHFSSARRESTGVVVVVVEEQKRRLEEELLRKKSGEGEERRRKDGVWVKPPPQPQPLLECIVLNDEEEDGVHGGRMKPLTSFDLNRGTPPSQNRKLKIKLSSTEDNPSSTTDRAAPNVLRRAQDKENGGLVPLCPGTTQIRGMKRKTVSPTGSKPRGVKRARPPNESGKTTDDFRKDPSLEMEGDGSQGMDMLLMALAADPNQRSNSPSQPMVIPAVAQATTVEKADEDARPTTRVRTAVTPLCQPQVQSKVLREDRTVSREEVLKASRSKNQGTMQYPQVKVKKKVDARTDDDEDLSCSDDDDDLSPEEYERKYGPFMKPHRYRFAPVKDNSVKIKETVDARKDDDEDSSCSDDDLSPQEYERKYGPVLKPHRYRPASLKYTMDKIQKEVEVTKDDEDLSSSDEDTNLSSEEFERKYRPTMKPHRYLPAPFKDTLDKTQKEVEATKEDEDLSCSDDDLSPEEYDRKYGPAMKPHRYRPAPFKDTLDKTQKEVEVTKENEDLSCSDEDLSPEEYDRKYGPALKPHRYRPTPFKDTLEREEPTGCGGDLGSTEMSFKKDVTRGHTHCITSREAFDNPQENLEASKEEDEDLKGREGRLDFKRGDGATQTCLLGPQRKVVTTGEAFPDSLAVVRAKLSGKSATSLEGRRENKGESSCAGDVVEAVITPHLSKVHPSQARVWSQGNTINLLSTEQLTGLNCSTSVESHHHQQKAFERETTEHDSSFGISVREDFEEGTTSVEKSHCKNQGDFRHLLPSTCGKYPGAGQQLSRKEFLVAARTTHDPHIGNSKKRKATGRNPAFCIVPKQVKLATASCLIDNGAPSHPSVGSVVVECLPPSNEQKEDNRAPFFEFQKRDGAVRSSHSSLLSAVDFGTRDTDKEISWVPGTASDRPSSAVVKVPCTQNFEVITRAQNDVSSLNLSGLSSVTRVFCSRTLGDTSSGHSLHPPRDSRTHVAPGDSKALYRSGLQYGSRVLQLQHPRPRNAPGTVSGACTSNEDTEARHEIAGITMQRRSWEALKSAEAEYFAKRRFEPKTESIHDNNFVPFIPSRFQNAENPIQRVSGVKPNSDFETHLRHNVTRSIGVTAHAGIAERRVTHRRGPKQGKQERLSTKVLNKNLEHFVQLNDASCHRVNAFRRLNQAPTGAHFPVDVSQLQPKFPLSRAYSELPKLPPLKTRQRRGPKKFEKERVVTISTKTTSGACHFKLLSEPSGLLGSSNPGIIGRVRNSKQIQAILGSLIGVASSSEGIEVAPSSSLPRVSQWSACVPVMPEVEGEIKDKSVKVQETFLKEDNVPQLEIGEVQRCTTGRNTENEQLHERKLPKETLDEGQPLLSNAEQCQSLGLTSETHETRPQCAAGSASRRSEAVNGDYIHEQSEPLTQMLSSLSGNPEYVEDDIEQELQPMSVTDSSSAAAGLAARWLELLSLDAEGRLSALKRSRRRVQSTLLSGPLNPDIGTADVMAVDLVSTRSAIDMDVLGSQQSVCSDATTFQPLQDQSSQQVDRWRALFSNMDVVLGKEATKLESWLWQIQQMQAFCPSSTQQSCSDPEKPRVAFCQGPATSYPEVERLPPQRWPLTIDAIEKELGFAASAASIMSTANFVTKVHNFR